MKECFKMLKEEWLTKCCNQDPLVLLRYLDVETYESVGEAVMDALLKDGMVHLKEGQSIRQYLCKSEGSEGNLNGYGRHASYMFNFRYLVVLGIYLLYLYCLINFLSLVLSGF